MIIGENFVWSHMPKTGGTTIEYIFNNILDKDKLGIVHIDGRDSIQKHDSIWIKEKRLAIDLSNKAHILNIRRMPNWVLSKLNHKNWRIPFDKNSLISTIVMSFYPVDSLDIIDLEEAWKSLKSHTPDSMLSHFYGCGVDYWMRTENINEDFISVFSKFFDMTDSEQSEITRAFENKRSYQKDIHKWLSLEDIKHMYKRNPFWYSIEKLVYGNVLC